jgi:flagellar biosynthesis protein FlhG
LLDSGIDQAQGLRRMFGAGPACVIEVLGASAGVGRTTVAVNLAVALARAGRHTLLLDAAAVCAATQRSAAGVQKAHVPGFAVAPEGAPAPLRALAPASPRPASARLSGLHGAAPEADCIVVSASEPQVWNWQTQSATQGLLVVSRPAASITAAYALIKRVGRQPNSAPVALQVLVNRVASEAEARQIFGNLADAARSYLGVRLQACGFVPADPALEQAAAQGRSVLQTNPDAPASRAFRRLAERLLRAAPRAVQDPPAHASPNRRPQASVSGAACTDNLF